MGMITRTIAITCTTSNPNKVLTPKANLPINAQ